MPFVENEGVRIHYQTEGKGPPIVLMHGFSVNSRFWYDFGYVGELSSNYRLILVDARGHGASDKPHAPEAYEASLMVRDLVAVLDDQSVSKAGFFGYSMGGRIGFRIPLYARDRFNSLILGGAAYPINGDEDAKDEILGLLYQGLDAAIKKSPENPMVLGLPLMERSLGQSFSQESRANFLSNDALALQAANLAFRRWVSPRFEEALPRFTMPSLILAGEADPRYSLAKECANRIPNSTFVSLTGLNHNQGFMRSDLTLPHVKRFLASHVT